MARVCEIPWTLRREEDATVRRLLDASGFGPFRSAVTPEALEACLGARPELLEAWARYSEDKRVASGWYLEGKAVGYYQPGKGMVRREVHPDAVRACADFILKELDGLLER